jgi:predicted transcriptional regulator
VLPPVERFWSKVVTNDETGCREWVGHRNMFGYGVTSTAGIVEGPRLPLLAHRAAWVLTHGLIPKGMVICHKCDHPPCCNPEHLFLGTQSENMRDAADKGRIPGKRKINAKQAREIRTALATDETTRSVAERFGLSVGAIHEIARGDAWKSIAKGRIDRSSKALRANKAKKLSFEDAEAVRRMIASGEKQEDVGEIFGITQGTVSRIVNRVRRPNDEGPSAPETNGSRYFTQEQVLRIRRRIEAGEVHAAIASEFNCTREAISRIAQGKSYAALTGGVAIERDYLTSEQVAEIERRLREREPQIKIAKDFDVSQVRVSQIKIAAGILTQARREPKARLPKMTPEQRAEILRRLAAGERQTAIAEALGTTQGRVSSVKREAGP